MLNLPCLLEKCDASTMISSRYCQPWINIDVKQQSREKKIQNTSALSRNLCFQASPDRGIMPTDWKSANVIPIYKNGDQSKPENYRTFFITCRTLTHNQQLNNEPFNLYRSQYNFRKNISRETHLLLTNQDLASTVENMGQTDIILLEFSRLLIKYPTIAYCRNLITTR